MTEFAGIFESLATDQHDARLASRKALVLSRDRIDSRLGRFLGASRSPEEFDARYALVGEDFAGIVHVACDEVGQEDHWAVVKTLHDHYRHAASALMNKGFGDEGNYVGSDYLLKGHQFGDACPHCGHQFPVTLDWEHDANGDSFPMIPDCPSCGAELWNDYHGTPGAESTVMRGMHPEHPDLYTYLHHEGANHQGPVTPEQVAAVQQYLIQRGRVDEDEDESDKKESKKSKKKDKKKDKMPPWLKDDDDDSDDDRDDDDNDKFAAKTADALPLVKTAIDDGDSYDKSTEDLSGKEGDGNTGLSGPSPKMDKQRWTPKSVKPIDVPSERHPTVQKDVIKVVPKENLTGPAHDIDEAFTLTTEETLPTGKGMDDGGFASNNMDMAPNTKTWGDGSQTDPVKSDALAA